MTCLETYDCFHARHLICILMIFFNHSESVSFQGAGISLDILFLRIDTKSEYERYLITVAVLIGIIVELHASFWLRT